jgi:hypothetical protein
MHAFRRDLVSMFTYFGGYLAHLKISKMYYISEHKKYDFCISESKELRVSRPPFIKFPKDKGLTLTQCSCDLKRYCTYTPKDDKSMSSSLALRG